MYFSKRTFLDSLLKENDMNKCNKGIDADQNKQRRPDKLFFNNLFNLEQKMTKEPSAILVTEVLAMYRYCVEYFDILQEPIKYYFIDKMQDVFDRNFQIMQQQSKSVISPDKSTKIESHLSPNQAKQTQVIGSTIYPTIIINQNEQQNSQIEKPRKLSLLGIMANPFLNLRSSSPKIRKHKVIAKMNSLQVQVEEQNSEQSDQKDTLLDEFNETTKDADKLVRNALQNQIHSVKIRLEKRQQGANIRTAMSRSQCNFDDDSIIKGEKAQLSNGKSIFSSQNLDNVSQVINDHSKEIINDHSIKSTISHIEQQEIAEQNYTTNSTLQWLE